VSDTNPSSRYTRAKRVFLRLVLGLLAISLSYLTIAHLFVFFPQAADFPASETKSIEIYVIDNGIHIDLVIPRQHALKNWDDTFIADIEEELDMLAIGWGDQAFYLETPNWSDLKISTALKALSGQNPSLLHVSYLSKSQLENETSIAISPAQYQALIAHIQSSTASATVYALENAGYTADDFFFPAKGHYSAIHTCNTWAADGLAKAGLKVPRWAPFPWLVTYYRKAW
jgi:uncharacterized protein (TIGR02117 family)